MTPSSLFRRPGWLVSLLALALAVPGLCGADLKFSTSDTLSTEARTLVQLLSEAHYNRDAVHSSDYAQIVPDYMAALDGQHLFFLGSDKADFVSRYGKNVYYNVAFAGNIDPAYEMFYIYQDRVQKRVSWIQEQLKGNFDFTGNETYTYDRTKSEWPANAAAADDLWQRALKSELIAEMMNKKTVDQAKKIVRERYERLLKNVGETEGSDLAERYLNCIAELYDPHSSYLSASTYDEFAIQMRLQLVGIGAVLESKDDYCVIRELVPGGPADLDHRIKPNDRIVAVAQDGQPPVEIMGMRLNKIVSMIRGAKDTHVHLTIQPANAADASTNKEVIITRDVVKLESARASAALFQVPGAGGKTVPLGVITLRAFYGQGGDDAGGENFIASQDIAKLIAQLKEANVQGIVLDLRHNGGGYLSEAVDIAGLFIHPGPVVRVRDSDGTVNEDDSNAPKVAYDGPLAVLVDRFSASASEIVTGALQDYGRAIIVGDSSTHGKGTVQTVLEMKNFPLLAASPVKTGAAKITIQKFYLPNGASTQLKGVLSDIVLPSPDDYMPIGESDLPHALVWDQIPGVHFDGQPLPPKLISQLRQDSLDRQAHLDEFAYLRKDVDWIKARLDEKQISLNMDERKLEQQQQDTFKKTMKVTRTELEKSDYAFKEFRLGPPRPPKVKPVKDTSDPKADKSDDSSDDDDDDELSTDDDTYGKLDVSLRETFRILNDAIDLGSNKEYWASHHAPLTVAADATGSPPVKPRPE